ncbi:hypothetical protein PR048_004593 [Dryococelus australis]|uniref:Uncharacterized protein n=1 Tax=Dryococelus australis TaxID=614101 RepID=A0ABQ9I7T0_9NEOP|nr:hypothetical protein PR048_004593 [Dryococelus australis]
MHLSDRINIKTQHKQCPKYWEDDDKAAAVTLLQFQGRRIYIYGRMLVYSYLDYQLFENGLAT